MKENPNSELIDDIQQYLSFSLSGEEYAIDILNVMEIRGWEEPRKLPDSSSCVKGVINLRGKIVPIVDLRERFSMSHSDYDSLTVVIVVQIEVNEEAVVLGMVVDAVNDVYDISHAEIKRTPETGLAKKIKSIQGIATIKDKMIIILNVQVLLCDDSEIDLKSIRCVLGDSASLDPNC